MKRGRPGGLEPTPVTGVRKPPLRCDGALCMALHIVDPTSDLDAELTIVAGRDEGAPTPSRRRQRSDRCDVDWLGRTCVGVCDASIPEGHGG